MYHKCLSLLLQPVFDAGLQGLVVRTPTGEQVLVHTRIMSQVGDNPQLIEDRGIMGSTKAQFSCELCLCPAEKMADIIVQDDNRWG